MRPGEIFFHQNFCTDAVTGELQSKYLLVLALMPDGDVVFRRLTSRQHGRPESPRCYHENPYPGFYLGVLGGPLSAKSWLVFNRQANYDRIDFRSGIERGLIRSIVQLNTELLCEALSCTARADDTDARQSKAMADTLATLR